VTADRRFECIVKVEVSDSQAVIKQKRQTKSIHYYGGLIVGWHEALRSAPLNRQAFGGKHVIPQPPQLLGSPIPMQAEPPEGTGQN
jgi:hypothetical protein